MHNLGPQNNDNTELLGHIRTLLTAARQQVATTVFFRNFPKRNTLRAELS